MKKLLLFILLISLLPLTTHAAYNASDLLGQIDGSGNPVFTTNAQDTSATTLYTPAGVALDAVHHRLFVSDEDNYRVVVYNLDSSNNIVDRTADYVLGEPDLDSYDGGTSQSLMTAPKALFYDSTDDWLFVADTGNNRVLIYNTSSITNGENAIYVLGQVDFNTTDGTGGTSASTLDTPRSLTYDSSNKLLFVGSGNSIFVFDLNTITNGEAAVHILGRASFGGADILTGASGIRSPKQMDFDQTNKRLFVAEDSNRRITVFDTNTITDGEDAVYVLGQVDFNTSNPVRSQTVTANPVGVTYDANRNLLYVSEQSHRIVVFDIATITNGEAAIGVLGQDDFVSAASGVTISKLQSPADIVIDSSNNRLYVADNGNARVLVYNFVQNDTDSVARATRTNTYTQSISTSNSQGTVSLSVNSGSLPSGVAISGTSLTGVPTRADRYSFSIRTKDDNGAIGYFVDDTSYNLSVDDTGGGLPSIAYTRPAGYSFVLNKGIATTNSTKVSAHISAELADGPNQSMMAISSRPDFVGVGQRPFVADFEYNLCEKASCIAGDYIVYAKVYTGWGQPSEVMSAKVHYEPFSEKSKNSVIKKAIPVLRKVLSFGSSDSQVQYLQSFLNNAGFAVAEAGSGSTGNETNYFGSATKKALMAFQEQYRDMILTPLGLVKPTGFLGASTLKLINSLIQ